MYPYAAHGHVVFDATCKGKCHALGLCLRKADDVNHHVTAKLCDTSLEPFFSPAQVHLRDLVELRCDMHEVTLTPAHTEDVVTLMDEQGQQIASDLSGAPMTAILTVCSIPLG